ncbi:MAG TPA: nuclear transport factor 2 family protein [Acidimicrobiales bacterium]|nr:nuclear transport factor 2 family protein [Acidimicrobiales bacterium]
MTTRTEEDFHAFVATCREAVARQVAGNTQPFQSLWSRDDDVVLIGAAGSHQKGWHDVSERLTWASQHLDFGGFHVENLLTCVSGDLAFTVDLEHMSREVDGKTEQRTLRSSQGYRIENGQWRVVFRHGDPMAADTVAQQQSGH